MQTQADSAGNITIHEKLGELDYRPASSLSYKEFSRYQDQRLARDYWRAKAAAADGKSEVTGRSLFPTIRISPVFDRIFGGNYIDFKTNGFVLLDFGGKFQRVQNPNIPVRQQRVPLFDFDQQVSLNAIGQVGEKMKMTANFDTKASFQFEQNLKLEYTGYEEDIIQKIEAGNVSMPVNSSLITGAQNLFGIKTQLRFGRLNVTSIAANQRASVDQVAVKGGVQTRKFEIRASDYEDNRHFFLSQFFRDGYESSLRTIPAISSNVTITRVEVYVTNRNNNTSTLRNIVGLLDLGETSKIYKPSLGVMVPISGNRQADNNANGLFAAVTGNASIRQADNTSGILDGVGLQKGEDYELIRASRRLSETEFVFNAQLGYISLNTPLRNDEVLAVAYEYTYQGRKYKVGELTEDYQNRTEDEVIILKLLRPSTVRVDLPTWNLMMKNIYSLGSGQINRQGFQLRVIYKDDLTGVDNPSLQEGRNTKDVPLVQVFKLDQLNPQNDPQIDGNFDFIEGITVDSRYGRIIFPVLEPFGSYLTTPTVRRPRQAPSPWIDPGTELPLVNKYVFTTLYRSTKQEAQQVADKNKFFLKGSLQSSASSEVMIPGIGADENSMTVTAGGVPLVLGQDYIIEGQKVRIINESIQNSGREINIQYEKPDLFQNQQRFLLGTRLDYMVNKDFIIGSTFMKLKERPLLTRVGLGNEPTNNAIFGVDANLRKESLFLTRLIDKLPFLETKEMSTINVSGEYAKLFPAVAPLAQNNSFIDDFEGAETPFDLTRLPQQRWKLGSTPQPTRELPQMAYDENNRLTSTYRRAKLAWYNVDNIFYRDGGANYPSNITSEDKQNHYVRAVAPQEVFPNRANYQLPLNESIFDLAFFPAERGMYNYNPNLKEDGTLDDPKKSWASITRAMTYDIDFDNANIQYIEFWLMDPFIKGDKGRVIDGRGPNGGINNDKGGDLYINLGSISEDVMKDGRHAFENGLPVADDREKDVAENDWGRVTTKQFLTNAFSTDPGSRARQDLGLDGLNSATESSYFGDFVSKYPQATGIANDPSGDDFKYFLDPAYDAQDAKILERYKNYNGMENNSPEAGGGEVIPASSTYPDNEDLNTDNTLNELEAYYQYKIPLQDGKLKVGEGYIVDKVDAPVGTETVTWYQFRIPIRENPERVGSINGFKSIRFMRMFLTNFEQPVVLRFAQYQLVSNQWRPYTQTMYDKGLQEPLEPNDANFTLSTVNIEENSQGGSNSTSPYKVPPGFIRDRDITTQNNRPLNEQSLRLCVEDLNDKDARAAFKNVSLDLINYKRLKMFFHADSRDQFEAGEVTGFIRLGTDFTENYYEIEVPLTLSRQNLTALNSTERDIWPEENEIDIAFADLVEVKANRNKNNFSLIVPYGEPRGENNRYTVRVIGNPDLSSVQTLMIGVRNPASPGDNRPKTVCVWANELRSSGFDQEGGWAATARVSAKLADFATITATARHTTYGFGGIQQKISERARENTTQWDVASTVNLDKLLPSQLGLKIPMLLSYERMRIAPRFNPLDPDMKLKDALNSLRSDRGQDKDSYRTLVEDNTTRRSINFTNVQKVKTNPDAKSHFYDIENLSFTYAYSDILQTNVLTEQYLQKNYKGGLAYSFNSSAKPIEPFKNIKFLSSPYFKWLQDFNFSLMPSSITVRGDLDRTFTKTQLRSSDLTTFGILPTYEKYFTFNRLYDVKWNLTKSLTFDYSATANALIDEPEGEINNEELRPGFTKRDSLKANIKRLGRMKNFSQRVTATYKLPLDKFPFTDWLDANVQYSAGYNWLAASLAAVDTNGVFFGNTMQNTRDRSVNGRIDLTRLYNKVKFLKAINTPAPQPQRTSNNLRQPQNQNKPAAKDTVDRPPDLKVLKGLLRVLMTARNINVTYSIEEGTILPGFLGTPRFFGLDSSFTNPGIPFVLGSQDASIRTKMAAQGLLSRSTSLNDQFSQNITENLNIRTALEPFRDFKIQLDAKRIKMMDYNEFYRFDSTANDFLSQNPVKTGNFSISFISIATAFKGDDNQNESSVFREYLSNRGIIKDRLEAINESDGFYLKNSQDVAIPAFIAAYSGKDPNKVSLNPFISIPMPNWRVDYAGLSRLEIFKNLFSSVNITHSYTSNFAVRNYTSSLEYGTDAVQLNGGKNTYPLASLKQDTGTYIPVYIIDQVTITERFAPLVGINLRTQSKVTVRVEYNQERNLQLSMSASPNFMEMRNKDFVVGVGFTKNNVRVPFKIQGQNVVLKNDLNFRCDFTLRDSKTITRSEAEGSTVTAGNLGVQLKPAINYTVNQRLNLQMYFERNINEPRISSSFRRAETNFGVQVRYSLSQ
ncbi:cell surface protein SprA [Rhodocytophaga rosea]|uniref:Cell surface protein SprA n=1 Tax=Rhodocytophaga rosea TaxID=2704465 RepID=A0A6C0GX58_9BACT|nr:cell surface protein SprA [Rhodocytophaga rosea]